MQISNDFKSTMEKVMYDKKVKKYEMTEEQDEELNIVKTKSSDSFLDIVCNIQPISNEIIKERYGLDIKAKYCITCSECDLNIGDYVEYLDKNYQVTRKA
jgi:hypothetical protein